MTQVYHKSTTFLETILETTALLEKYKTDPNVNKMDVIDVMEDQLSFMCGKLVSVPICTSFALFRDNADSTT